MLVQKQGRSTRHHIQSCSCSRSLVQRVTAYKQKYCRKCPHNVYNCTIATCVNITQAVASIRSKIIAVLSQRTHKAAALAYVASQKLVYQSSDPTHDLKIVLY